MLALAACLLADGFGYVRVMAQRPGPGGGDDGTLSLYRFAPTHGGWSGRFPGGRRTLFGKSIEVTCSIDTRPIDWSRIGQPPAEDPPAMSPSQAALLERVIASLPAILPRVEQELRAYNRDDPTFAESISGAHLWLDFDCDDGRAWSFVVTAGEESDFAWHLEFDGMQFVSIWAGS